MNAARTLYDKLWEDHVVHVEDDGTTVLYIDRHLVHEVTSPQAYEGLRLAGRAPWRISSIVATADHNTPTTGWEHGYGGIDDPISKEQIVTLDSNIRSFGAAAYFPFLDKRQGIVHVMGPEQGATLPGMTVVCGDSHTSTHGAFGALAFGIGTSEVEHVLATQTLLTKKAGNMLIKVDGRLPTGCTAKDIVLSVIGRIGTAGGTGYAIEFAGEAIEALSMEGRMTVCNMTIEAGARAGMVAVDEKTIEYVRGRPFSPSGEQFEQAARIWRTLRSDPDAKFDRMLELRAEEIKPQVTWGTSPEMVTTIDGTVPDPEAERDPVKREGIERALDYMGLQPKTPVTGIFPRQGVHRLVYQLAHRGSARSRVGGQAAGQASCWQREACDGRARIGLGQGAGRTRRARQDFSRRGLRVARTRLFDVSGDERGPARAGRALRIDQQSQFRRPPGHRRPDTFGVTGDGGCRRDRGTLRRRSET